MPKFTAPLDLSRAELRNAVTQNLTAAPAAPGPGLRYYDSILTLERYWNGTKWVDISDTLDAASITGLGDLAYLDQVTGTEIAPDAITDLHISPTAAIALSKLAVDPLARINHTGTQLAATISDFDTQVRTSRLDQMAVPTATVDFGGQIITGVATPTQASDVANKNYVDQIGSGLDVKAAVQAASVGNIDLTGPGTKIDNYNAQPGDRVLVKDQTVPVDNGVYVYNGPSVAMTRALDADEDAEVKQGLYVFVAGGATNSNSGWMLNTPNPIVVGTTALNFVHFSGGGSTYTGTLDRINIIGTQIDIASTYVGQPTLTTLGTITTGTWNGTPIDIAYGGTGATTAAQARLNLGVTSKYITTIGAGDPRGTPSGAAVSFAVNHALNTTSVGVELFDASTGQTVYADVRRTDPNNVTIDGFVNPPASNSLNVVVWG